MRNRRPATLWTTSPITADAAQLPALLRRQPSERSNEGWTDPFLVNVPLLAQSGSPDPLSQCLLSGVKRTLPKRPLMLLGYEVLPEGLPRRSELALLPAGLQ